MCKNENRPTKKYMQIEKILKNKQQFKMVNKVFCSNDLNDTFDCMKDALKIDFHDQEKSIQEINSGVADSVEINKFCSNFLRPDMKLLLTNTISYENYWRTNDRGSAIMKVYNSFNYTEDIKYEARLLELPMQDDFKLVIIIPNEVDVLCNLFNKLITNGLTAAIGSIQPLFMCESDLRAPSIKFSSTSDTIQHYNDYSLVTAEFGNFKVDENGVFIKVFTCTSPTFTRPRDSPNTDRENLKSTFFFGLIFKDTPIFTGQYVNVK